MKKKTTRKGFTLVEMLVSIGIFVTVSSIIITALISALRTSKKSESLITIRQNGDAALAQMERAIRFASELNDPAGCVDPIDQTDITITSSSDHAQTTFSCEPGVSITSNSAEIIDSRAVTVTTCSFVCTQATRHDPPTITIRFTLDASGSAGFVETQASMPFQTSVTMRNFSP